MTPRDDDLYWIGPYNDPNRYQLVRNTAIGGEGGLWEAWDPKAKKPVAVKVVPGIGHPSEQREWDEYGALLRRLKSPHLARVYDIFLGNQMHDRVPDPRLPATVPDPAAPVYCYTVMKWIDGHNLSRWLEGNRSASIWERLALTTGLAHALDYLHRGEGTDRRPVVHGDVKPPNAMVDTDGISWLVDLGLTRLLGGPGKRGGTPGWTAPEADPQTPAGDRFSFYLTVATVLTGKNPVALPNSLSPDLNIVEQNLRSAPLLQHRGDLQRTVMAALRADPAQRPWLAAWHGGLVDQLSRPTGPIQVNDTAPFQIVAVPLPPGPRPKTLPTPPPKPKPAPKPTPVPSPPPPARPTSGVYRRSVIALALVAAVLAVIALGVNDNLPGQRTVAGWFHPHKGRSLGNGPAKTSQSNSPSTTPPPTHSSSSSAPPASTTPSTTPPPPPPPPTITASLASATVTTGATVGVTFHGLNVPAGDHVVLQRQAGTGAVWGTVATLKGAAGQASTPPIPMGVQTYRAAVTDSSGNVLTASKVSTVYSYATVSLGAMLGGATTRSIVIGNNSFNYVEAPNVGSIFYTSSGDTLYTDTASSCRSISLAAGVGNDTGNAGDVLSVISESRDPVRLVVPINTVIHRSAPLTRGDSFSLTMSGDVGIYINGTASCYAVDKLQSES